MRRDGAENVAVRNGCWGEDRAVEYLRLNGYVIIERNARPSPRDRRLEVDVVAYEVASETLVFVEVKTHARHQPGERRLRSVNRRKLQNVRRAFNAWRRLNRWSGGYRFDVIEVFGTPGAGRPEIDHVMQVGLFVPREKFVNWRT